MARRTPVNREADLSSFFDDYVGRDVSARRFVLRRPHRVALAGTDLLRLPRLTANPSDTVEGARIRHALFRRDLVRSTFAATSALHLPETAEEYSLGASRQTVRRKVRQAQKRGVKWRVVDDPQERRELLALSNEWERSSPADPYEADASDNDDLPDYRL